MNRYGHAGNDKAMPAILNEGSYDAWLNAKVNKAKSFCAPTPPKSCAPTLWKKAASSRLPSSKRR